jgi:2-polyprenyl-6-methoxyphenol hydroxylase-like FAD-dependent oxidoreductase
MSATTSRTDCDVLVVGAGPTGLTLAAHLLARGVRARLIDKDPGTPRLSRAIAIQPRTLETLDMMGIADRFLDLGHRVRAVNVYADGRRRVGIDMAYSGSSYPFQLHLPQHRTEALLRERIGELGGAVEAGRELIDLGDDGDVVTAVVRDPSGCEHEVSASFVVGCDGAHSRVRHLLDVPFLGQPYPWDWLLADAQVEWTGRPDEVHVFARPDGLPLACIPITEHLWRLSLPTTGDRGGRPPTLEEVQALVDARGPAGMLVSNPEALTSFRCQIRSSSVHRRGRVLLAGDAVHIHSPAGGQGMNTGMLDATNLGWKLAGVVTGQAPDRLLDTYGPERGPVAEQVLTFTQAMVAFATAGRSLRRTVRNAALPAFRLPPVQRRLAGRMSQVAVRYPSSHVNPPGRLHGLPKPGDRMPDVAVIATDGPSTLHAALRPGRHVLVVSDQAADDLDLDQCREIAEIVTARLGHHRGVALVRPDGYLAAVGTADDCASVHAYLAEHTPIRSRTP